jgi:hypothetical protein
LAPRCGERSPDFKHPTDEGAACTRTLVPKPKGVKGRFVRVVAHTNGLWLFADEIFVNPEPADD